MADTQRAGQAGGPATGAPIPFTEKIYRETIVGRLPIALERQQILAKVHWSQERTAKAVIAAVDGAPRELYGALRDLEWKIGSPEFPGGAWTDPKELSLIADWAEPVLAHIMVRSSSFETRLQAAYLAGRLAGHAAGSAPVLKWIARDRGQDESLRDQAVASIGSVLGNRSGPFLFDVLAGWRKESPALVARAAYTLIRSVSARMLKEFAEPLIIISSAFLDGCRGEGQEWEKEQILNLLCRIGEVDWILAGRVRQILTQFVDDENESRVSRGFALSKLCQLVGRQALPILDHYSCDETLGQHASLSLFSLVNGQGWLLGKLLRFRYRTGYRRGEMQSNPG